MTGLGAAWVRVKEMYSCWFAERAGHWHPCEYVHKKDPNFLQNVLEQITYIMWVISLILGRH